MAKFPEETENMLGWKPDVPVHLHAAVKLKEDCDRITSYLLERADA